MLSSVVLGHQGGPLGERRSLVQHLHDIDEDVGLESVDMDSGQGPAPSERKSNHVFFRLRGLRVGSKKSMMTDGGWDVVDVLRQVFILLYATIYIYIYFIALHSTVPYHVISCERQGFDFVCKQVL